MGPPPQLLTAVSHICQPLLKGHNIFSLSPTYETSMTMTEHIYKLPIQKNVHLYICLVFNNCCS